MPFSNDFLWGAASAAYQIEGAANADGKGDSVWDAFCRQPGKVWEGNSGEIACDHYHRHEEDVAAMKGLGLRAYRFSISWPRVLPDGAGAVNSRGLDFYSRLVDELLAAGITPCPTLFHWDFPAALHARGGWLERDSADWFAEYARVVARALGDRAKMWFTLNEPQVFVVLGHWRGEHAPGDTLGRADLLKIAHNVLRAHGKAVTAIRAEAASDARAGIAFVGAAGYPHDENNPDDLACAREAVFGDLPPFMDSLSMYNKYWFDPPLRGSYPEKGLEYFGADAPEIHAGDLECISAPIDFIGLNIYHGRSVRRGADGQPELHPLPSGFPRTAYHWPVTPEALRWTPRFFCERYGKPVYITENGMANVDWIGLDGKVHDPQRIDFTRRYLLQLRRAVADGADIRGYFHWSIMDNFEWAAGYRERFGLIYVDYPTQRRVWKDSAHWYQRVIATHGGALDEDG